MWKDLGITDNYKRIFDKHIKSLSDLEKDKVLFNEKNDLKNFGDALLKFKKEIRIRKNNINSFKKYITPFFKNSINNKEIDEINFNLIRIVQD